MANHRKKSTISLPSLTRNQWIRIAAATAAVVLVVTGGVVTRGFYLSDSDNEPQVTSYSATSTDSLGVSRGTVRDSLQGVDENTSYVTVTINGESRIVLGENFTTVKSVLEAGNITLEPTDTIDPALDEQVTESTVIAIERAGAELETTEETISYSTIRKETDELPEGTEEVQTEGQDGVMEVTALVTRSGDTVVSSNVFASYVKQEPVDEIILVGTSSSSDSDDDDDDDDSSSSIGTTVATSDMQQWAHDYLIDNGYTEEDFTATVYIINHESGWRVDATNASSGAYGLPQALPGSKMASAGDDWETNYQTQLKWFWSYCESRYGSITAAYTYWIAHGYY